MRWTLKTLSQAGRWLQQRLFYLALLIALAGGAWYVSPAVLTWWQGLTPVVIPPTELGVSVSEPVRTKIEYGYDPDAVRIHFDGNAVPLSFIGLEATGISIEPAIAGKWVWRQVNRLEFRPTEDWPTGQKYTVDLSKAVLAENVLVKKKQIDFHSPFFSFGFENSEFYQDPTQFDRRHAVFTLRFTHPVNTAELEKRLTLSYDATCEASDSLLNLGSKPCERLQYTVSYDKWKQVATIQSEALPLPDTQRSVALHIDIGVLPKQAGYGTRSAGSRYVSIPGRYGLGVSDVRTNIVTGENGEPEHVLSVSASMPVHERELARAVQAWVLPETLKESDPKGQRFNWADNLFEVNEDVLKRSRKLTLEALASELEVTSTVSFKVPKTEGGQSLLVRVDKGLKSPGGFQLPETLEFARQLKLFEPELSIMSKGSLLALSGEKKLPIMARDLPGVRVEVGRLLPKQLQHLVTQSSGDFSHPRFYNSIKSDDLVDRFEKQIRLNSQPGKAHYEAVDFGSYLHKDPTNRRGVFLLKVRGFDPEKAAKKADQKAEQKASRLRLSVDENEDEDSDFDRYRDDDDHRNDAYEDYYAHYRQADEPEGYRDQRLILVTDLGLVVKKSLAGTRDVFVQSIATGQPVADAQVEVWGRNGVAVVSQNTDATGRASLPNLAGYQREQAPAVLVVRKGGDLSFLPLNRDDRMLDVSRFDVGGLRTAGVPNQMTGYLFSDRGMYRPGDPINVAMIVKTLRWNPSLADLPMEVEINDARGLTVRREKLRLGPGGTAEIAHTTDENSPTGNYTVNLLLPRQSSAGAPDVEGLLIGSTTVKVQEFIPDRTKVKLTLSKQANEGWVHPKDLSAHVDVQNLFGTPAQNRKVEGTLTLTPALPSFSAYANYSFFDPQRLSHWHDDELGTAETDETGQVEFNLRLSRFAAATYQARVIARAFEPEGGRSVSAEAQTLVSDLDYLVGYSTDGDLGYVTRGSSQKVSLIAVDPQVKKLAVPQLLLQRVENKVLSVLVKQSNGLYRYESRRKEVLVEETPYAISSDGESITLNTATPGNFAYILRNAKNQVITRIDYSVAGNANVTRSLDRNAELQLTLDRKDYQPGQEISVSVRAPYVGAGLITIERDKVYAHKWFKTGTTASVQKITVPKDFEGTGYVTVHFVRDPSSDEIYMSPLSYGVMPFATTLSKRSANISLTSTELIKPGETIKMKLTSDKPTHAVVFAVDEGILQVARYKTPDPLADFFQKRALEVSTMQTLDMILPEFKKLMQGAAPGGDGEGALGKHLNPFKRKRDKPVTYWSGIVEVNGSREFSYTPPDRFNGSLRVMAVAVSDEAVAAKSTSTSVRGDMVILPNAPLAMTPGDTVEVGVGLANNIVGSGQAASIALTLSAAQGLEVVGDATQTLKINERGEGSTKFRVRAKDGAKAVLGSAPLVFNASYKNLSTRITEEVSIRPASPYVTLVQAGSFQRSTEIKSQSDFYPNFRKDQLAISTAPWAYASGLMKYLQAYPHGCTEQITSQTYPTVLLATRPELAREMQRASSAEEGVPLTARQTWDRYLVQLRPRQTDDGGFSLWPGGVYSDSYATLYAVQLLVDAKERKLPVPPELLHSANTYLQNWLINSNSYQDSWRHRTQAIYLLTRQGIIAPAALANLRDVLRRKPPQGWRDDLGAVYLAASYQLVKQEDVAKELLDPVWADLLTRTEKKQRRNVWDRYYDPMVHDSMTLAIVARHFPEHFKKLKPKIWENMARMVQDGWYNSLSSASMLLAVDAYFDAVGQSVEGKLKVQTVNARNQVAELALGSIKPIAQAALPTETKRLKLKNNSDFNLYYSWSEQGFERNVPARAENKGIEVTHEVLDTKGRPTAQVTLGEEVTMRVRIRSLDRSHINDIALVSMLPGGLEPVLQSASDADDDEYGAPTPIWKRRLGSSGSWDLKYADIREDRVVMYGDIGTWMSEITYKVRATNVGEFVIPPAYGEAMYDRRIFSRSMAGTLKIVPR